MFERQLESQHTYDEQLTVDDGLSERPVNLVHIDGLLVGVQNSGRRNNNTIVTSVPKLIERLGEGVL